MGGYSHAVRSLSFLLSRRWVLFGVAVVLLAWLAWFLGEWQFQRLEERKERNAIVERNVDAAPVPAAELLAVGEPVERTEEWRRVTATGEYDAEHTVVVRYRTRDGKPGVDVVVPLVTAEGPALLVDRGWMPTDNQGATPEEIPAPPAGEVTVTGWVRRDATDATKVTDQSTRAISSEAISEALDIRAYGGFLELESEDPPAADPLERVELPDLGQGPHFFYGLQWWFFGLLAVTGFVYLAYDERRKLSRSQGAEQAPVDRHHGAGDE